MAKSGPVMRIMLVAVLLTAAYCLLPKDIHAGGSSGIDVVLVMDSSGSMKKTDPASLRIPAARLFISLLGKNDRAGVVSFSDKAYPLLGLTPADTEDNRKALLTAAGRISSDGSYTNLHAALYEGLSMLSRNRRAGSTPIIILMSDGMMDTGDQDKDRELVDTIRNELSVMLEGEQIRVYTIAFTGHSDRVLLEKISKRTGGFFNLALTDADFHLVFASIFESLKAPDMLPIQNNGFFIDSSVDEVTIVATKESPDTKLRLTDPAGKSFSSSSAAADLQWFASDRFDMITCRKPLEGRWSILFSSAKDNRAYIITNLSLQYSFDKLYATFGETLDLRIWLERDGSTITEKEVLDKIELSVEVIGPDGSVTVLEPFAQADGIYVRRIATFTPGNHTLRVSATGKTFEREKTIVFNVAGISDSKKDILEEREKNARDAEAIEQHGPEEPGQHGISWFRVTAQFMGINTVLAALVFMYFRIKGRTTLTARADVPAANNTEKHEAQPETMDASAESTPQHEIPLDDQEEGGEEENHEQNMENTEGFTAQEKQETAVDDREPEGLTGADETGRDPGNLVQKSALDRQMERLENTSAEAAADRHAEASPPEEEGVPSPQGKEDTGAETLWQEALREQKGEETGG